MTALMNHEVKKNIILYFLTDITGFVSLNTIYYTMTWLTFNFTNSPSSLSLVGFAGNLPFLLFSIYAGVLADKHQRKIILIYCISGMLLLTLIVIILTLFKDLNFPLILIFSFLFGSIIALHFPAMIGLVKDIIPDKKYFPRVMGAASSNPKIGQIISSSTFSIIFTAYSAIGNFLFSFVSNLIALICLLLIKKPEQEIILNEDSAFKQMKDGLKYVLKSRPLFAIMLTTTMNCIVFGYVMYQLPIIDSEFLDGAGTSNLGILYLAGAIGGMTAGIYLGKRKSTKNILKFYVLCTILSGISAIGMSVARVLWLDFIFAIGVDFSLISAIGVTNTVIQILTKNSMRGRILGVNISFNWGIMAVVTTVLGFIGDNTGDETILNIIGAAAIFSGIIYFLTFERHKSVLLELNTVNNLKNGQQPYD